MILFVAGFRWLPWQRFVSVMGKGFLLLIAALYFMLCIYLEKKLKKIPCYICSLSFAKWKYSSVKITSYGMYMLYCPDKDILQIFGLQLSSDLNLVPFMVPILACSARHTCVMLRQEVPFLLWNRWPLLIWLTFIVWQNPNGCVWYMASAIEGLWNFVGSTAWKHTGIKRS